MLVMGTILPTINIPLAIQERWHCIIRLRDFRLEAYLVDPQNQTRLIRVQRATMKWLETSEECVQFYKSTNGIATSHAEIG